MPVATRIPCNKANSLNDLIQDDTFLDRGPAIELWRKDHNGKTLRQGKLESHGLMKFAEWLATERF